MSSWIIRVSLFLIQYAHMLCAVKLRSVSVVLTFRASLNRGLNLKPKTMAWPHWVFSFRKMQRLSEVKETAKSLKLKTCKSSIDWINCKDD
jgi:hypothetical protein